MKAPSASLKAQLRVWGQGRGNGLSSLPRVTAKYSYVAKKIAVIVKAIN